MYTVGAILIALPSYFICLLLFVGAGTFLGNAIYQTTGILWTTVAINSAMSACSAYAAMFFSLKVVPRSSIKAMFNIMTSVVVLNATLSLYKAASDNYSYTVVYVGIILGAVASVLGCYICQTTILEERCD
ncbi:hypothetical protein [Halodesulfovibrio sp. MK-HDV]|jgi:hypothetical protein|uniref:hypothetical protein n=1 Tax=Halodesulfovibrio sp. MK-HDV TaxID=2599925 RepID=UPI00136C58F2|nr:hypothetical protein [Halodesulfovibrio sp. MK-HDV]KAF1074555.1 hypothetical protein MKHDV_02630 [Halodesulfovibrio sp. MK-HDV]